MEFDVKGQTVNLSDLFDDNVIDEILKEDEMRNNINFMSDFVAIINKGFCTELELQELKQQCDHALKNNMCNDGYVKTIDFCDADAICETISCMPYSKMELQRIIALCNNKLKNGD